MISALSAGQCPYVSMTGEIEQVEAITSVQRRHHWSAGAAPSPLLLSTDMLPAGQQDGYCYPITEAAMGEVGALVQRYYGDRPLMQRIDTALRAAGVDPERPHYRDLWPFEHLHLGGSLRRDCTQSAPAYGKACMCSISATALVGPLDTLQPSAGAVSPLSTSRQPSWRSHAY